MIALKMICGPSYSAVWKYPLQSKTAPFLTYHIHLSPNLQFPFYMKNGTSPFCIPFFLLLLSTEPLFHHQRMEYDLYSFLQRDEKLHSKASFVYDNLKQSEYKSRTQRHMFSITSSILKSTFTHLINGRDMRTRDVAEESIRSVSLMRCMVPPASFLSYNMFVSVIYHCFSPLSSVQSLLWSAVEFGIYPYNFSGWVLHNMSSCSESHEPLQ